MVIIVVSKTFVSLVEEELEPFSNIYGISMSWHHIRFQNQIHHLVDVGYRDYVVMIHVGIFKIEILATMGQRVIHHQGHIDNGHFSIVVDIAK